MFSLKVLCFVVFNIAWHHYRFRRGLLSSVFTFVFVRCMWWEKLAIAGSVKITTFKLVDIINTISFNLIICFMPVLFFEPSLDKKRASYLLGASASDHPGFTHDWLCWSNHQQYIRRKYCYTPRSNRAPFHPCWETVWILSSSYDAISAHLR